MNEPLAHFELDPDGRLRATPYTPPSMMHFIGNPRDRDWLAADALASLREPITHFSNIDAPMEACGFVLAGGRVVHCPNVDDAPWYRFRMDPKVAAAWWETGDVVGVWHSHPTGPALASDFDREVAAGHPTADMLVYSVEDEDLATYRLHGDRFILVSLESPPIMEPEEG